MVKLDKSRYVCLYPTAEKKALWRELAKKKGMQPAKLIIKIVGGILG